MTGEAVEAVAALRRGGMLTALEMGEVCGPGVGEAKKWGMGGGLARDNGPRSGVVEGISVTWVSLDSPSPNCRMAAPVFLRDWM